MLVKSMKPDPNAAVIFAIGWQASVRGVHGSVLRHTTIARAPPRALES
jgi:hypothetical protein